MSERLPSDESSLIPKPESSQPEETPEHALSPETIERIMDKVLDINAQGTAVHAIHLWGGTLHPENIVDEKIKMLHNMLRTGMLSMMSPIYPALLTENQLKQSWKHRALESKRKDRYMPLSVKELNKGQKFSDNNWFNDERDPIAIIIDPKFMASKLSRQNSRDHRYENETDINRRIAPRFFKGIVFDVTNDPQLSAEEAKFLYQHDELISRRRALYEKYWTKEAPHEHTWPHEAQDELKRLRELLNNIDAQRQVTSPDFIRNKSDFAEEAILDRTKLLLETERVALNNKPDSLLPIYDKEGNLWWPKQMSYENVKKFVAERDSKEKPE